MKKSLLLLIFAMLLQFNSSVSADSWDDFSNVDRMWDGQKSITNKEFEQVVDALEEKSKQREDKKRKKKIKKKFGSGTILHDELNPENNVRELSSIMPTEDLILNVSTDLFIDGKSLERGFYKVLPEVDKRAGKKYINFYQSQYFKGKVEIIDTEDDFGEQELNFVKLLPYNEEFVKVIFGSLEFNGYVYLPMVK